MDGHACPGDASEKEEAEDCLSAGYVRAGCEAGAAQFAFACLFDSFLRSNALLPELSIDRNRNLRGDFLSLVATTGSPVPPDTEAMEAENISTRPMRIFIHNLLCTAFGSVECTHRVHRLWSTGLF